MRHLAFALLLGGCFFEPAKPGTSPGPPPPAQPGVAQLAAGDRFACSIRPDKTLVCWGDDEHGQLGTAGLSSPAPHQVPGTNWTQIAAGGPFACGLNDAGLTCWGFYGVAQYEPHVQALPTGVTAAKLFGSDGEMCAISTAGDVYCIGQMFDGGSDGMGGRGVQRMFADWTKLSIGGTAGTWDSLALGYASSCAINTAGQAYCWGVDGQWELGVDPSTQSGRAIEEAIAIPGYTFKRATTGSGGSCGITDKDQLVCWGGGIYAANQGPTVVDTHTWTGITGQFAFICGIRDTKVWCYGGDTSGTLGDGFAAHPSLTTPVYDDASEVVSGAGFVCATNGTDVSCWGSNEYGEIGNGKTAVTTGPTMAVELSGSLGHVVASVEHSCVLVNSVPTCWGGNHGHESVATNDAAAVPTPTTAIATPLGSLTATQYHTCGLNMSTNAVECWGDSQAIGAQSGFTHQLGPPDANPLHSVAVADGSTCTGSSVSGVVQCVGDMPWGSASTVTGSLVAVGTGFLGAAAGSTLTYAGEPCSNTGGSVSVPSGQAISSIAAGDVEAAVNTGTHVCLIDASADIYCFGKNAANEVEPGSTTCVPPTSMHKVTGPWAQVSVSGDHTCALDMQGHLYCWGDNIDGALGPGGSIATPTQIGTDQWNEVSAGLFHTCGIKLTDGKLYCWGLNVYGEAGPGERFHEQPTPVQF
jgi:alpha-tubulin suppressor-like RCC1 family protein